MEWVIENWEYIVLGILVIDKIVAITPTDRDDLIWTGIKDIVNTVLKTVKKKG